MDGSLDDGEDVDPRASSETLRGTSSLANNFENPAAQDEVGHTASQPANTQQPPSRLIQSIPQPLLPSHKKLSQSVDIQDDLLPK